MQFVHSIVRAALSLRPITRHLVQLTLLGAALITGATALAAGGEAVLLRKTYSGNIDYVATGASFRDTPNATDQCSFASPMESTVVLNIPAGATILDAYLYYAGSADINSTYITGAGVVDLNSQNLTLNGVPISNTASTNDRNFTNITGVGGGVVDFFGARRDVSDIVTGAGAYTLAGMVVHTEAPGQNRPTTGTCLGAWSLVVIYEDPSITNIRVMNLFDGFRDFQNTTFDLQPRNFVVAPGSPSGKMTHMSFEGDENIVGTESFELHIGGGAFVSKTNALNPSNNQYNSTMTGPDVFDSSTTYGFDLDTYDISPELVGKSNEYTATTRYNSGQDIVLLMSEMIIVDNKDLADIEITLNDVGLFQASTTNSAQYVIDVHNNGDGTDNISSGAATGYIHVYDDLPAGISIDSLTDITAPGWDCTATNLSLNQVRCSYDLSTLGDGELDWLESLPSITITVDVGTPVSPVTNTAYVSLCASSTDTCTTFTGKHTNADQFDPVNFFEDFETLFDVNVKSSINNNVDREFTSIITGTPSDLSTSTKSVVDLNGGTVDPGDILEYTITLTETAGVSATSVEVNDTIDTDTTSFTFQSTSCSGSPVNSFAFDTLTVTGITVPASSSCDVVFRVTIKPTSVAGTFIDNSALISNGNGTDGNPVAPTLLVAGAATGSKILYLDSLASAPRNLTRVPPVSDSTTDITTGNSVSISLNPTLAADLQINSGIIPVSVWVEALSDGTYDLTAQLSYQGGTVIGSDIINNVAMTTGSGNAQLYPFTINLATDITDLNTSEEITLTITNGGGSAGTARIHSLLDSIDSNLIVDAADVINVDSISFFSDVARTIPAATIEAGQIIYVEAVISDPFGAFDITNAKITLKDPNNATQVSLANMTEDVGSATAGTKTYYYAYSVPSVVSIDPGVWNATVKAFEGQEGTVTHTDSNTFTTTAPAIEVDYNVSPLTANAGDTLTYTITVTNSGGSPASVDLNQAIPVGTQNLVVTSLPSGTDASTSSTLDITGITIPVGVTVITFTVDVSGTAQPGDLINHTISLDNAGNPVTDIAPSVLINPFFTNSGNKLLYADNLASTPRLDRTVPVSNTTRSVLSQGGSTTLTLSPVLQSDLTLSAGDITSSVWVSRGSSFAGERTIQATLGYTGASSGTIGSDSVTITLQSGTSGAQYIPFTINLASPLTILANSSLTLTITNNTAISGETITVHSFKDSVHPTQVGLNANSPLNVIAVEAYNNDIDSGGVPITATSPSSTVWVVATVEDPFGADDITSATLTVTDPLSAITLNAAAMSVPTTQPASGAQKYFQLSHTLSAELGDWDFSVTAKEGTENTVTATGSTTFNVNNNTPDLTDSYKTVTNVTSGSVSNTNAGDTLRYTIALLEIGGSAATGVAVTDTIPTGTTFVSGTLKVDGVVQADPGGTINLTGLTVPANGTTTVTFDVTVDGPGTPGTIISNTATITNPSGVVTSIDVSAQDIVIAGAPATGTKLIYLEDLNTSPYLTRAQPQVAGTTDLIFLNNGGGSVSMELSPPLRDDLSINPADGDITISLRMRGVGRNNRTRTMNVDFGYQTGATYTSIGSVNSNIFLSTGATSTGVFVITPVTTVTVPEGSTLKLVVTNQDSNNNDDLNLYSFDSGSNRSTISLNPTPVINVDEISFWTDSMGAGTQTTNPDPDGTNVDIYARIVISDPFGEADIQAPDAGTNPTTVSMTNPDANVALGGSPTCSAPCYAYVGEDTTNDPAGDNTRTFYYIVRLDADPPATRGTWTMTVIANEGLETGSVSHTSASNFSTLKRPDLSTSTKTWTHSGDVDPGETLTYTVTLINTGGLDAD
ncbi:MAG: DUF11 domain-containing protein, partial [Pseudomonadales bacterium]|nr:DUF11 domain-containing protein [Pseudomonadales bacterium]